MSRDDFTSKIKRKLAKRAGGRCSNPSCDVSCWLLNSISEKLTNIGEVAHIYAASKDGGPRFNADMSSDARKSIENAIFLCANCYTLLDVDESTYTSKIFTEWKASHEAQIRGLA